MELPLTLSFINSLVKLNNNTPPSTLQADILDILQHSDDDDKPDRLKAFIDHHLPLHLPDHQLNQIILALLHQHRQDLNPNSNYPQQNQLPSELLIINQSKLLTNRSRFQQSQTCSNSNSSSSAPSTPPPSARLANQSTAIAAANLLPPSSKFPSIHLPWSEKLNASASEFKPSLSRAVSLPFRSTTPSNTNRSPLAPPTNSNHLWAYHPSTLEQHHSSLQSPNGNNHPYHHHQQQQQQHHRYSRPTTPEIPRDPWLRDDLDQKHASNKSLSPNPIEYNSDEQDVAFDLFSPFHPSSPFKSPSLPPISTQTDQKQQQEPSCPTALQWGLSPEMAEEMAQFTVWDQSDSSDGSLPPTIVHHPAEEDANSRYCMTPFDELSSALTGTGVTVNQIEQALSISDFDISKALDWLLERNGMLIHPHNPALLHTDQPSKFSASSRDSSLNRPGGAHHSLPTSPRFAPVDPHSPNQRRSKASSANHNNSDEPSPLELNPAHRICRFYLQGCCLRSDCKFSHDVGKAICRFWLKGNCLKGEGRCDFLHEIPDLISKQQEEEENNQAKSKNNTLNIKSFADEFPSLNESLLSNNNRKSNHHNNQQNKASRLRPVALLPDGLIDPSPSLVKLCLTYSSQSFDFSSRRKECFELAKESFKRGDGTGVKKWSKEGDQWNKKLGEEGRAVAGLMITERNRLMKDAVREMVSDRISKVDEAPDRMQRGKEMGGGICLGVVKPSPSSSSSSSSVKERTEVLMDLHGLQPEDAVYYLEKFLLALKTEGYQGLAYVILTITKKEQPSPPSNSITVTTNTTTSTTTNTNGENLDGQKLKKTVSNWLDKKKIHG